MGDFPIGVYRSATFGTTISNYAGATGQPGGGPVRIFSVHLKAATVTPTGLTFHNGVSAAGTGNAYLNVSTNSAIPSSANWDAYSGILFPNGCTISTDKAIQFGTVMFRNETL